MGHDASPFVDFSWSAFDCRFLIVIVGRRVQTLPAMQNPKVALSHLRDIALAAARQIVV
jgi:hypothetical protein